MITPAELKAKIGPYISPSVLQLYVAAGMEVQRKMEFIYPREGMKGLEQFVCCLDERTVHYYRTGVSGQVEHGANVVTAIREDFEWWITNEMDQAGWTVTVRPALPADGSHGLLGAKAWVHFSVKPKQ